MTDKYTSASEWEERIDKMFGEETGPNREPDGTVPVIQEACVYAIIDTHTDKVLYVGESKRLFGRIKNHLYEKSDSCLFGRLANDPNPPFEPEGNWRKRLAFDYWKIEGGRKHRQQAEDEMVEQLKPVYPPK